MDGNIEALGVADRALIAALRAWGGAGVDRTRGRFSSPWRSRLAAAWSASRRLTPEAAWDDLRRDHDASTRLDPARVHRSWYVRALQDEPPSVLRAVAAHAPRPIARAIREGRGLDESDLATDHPADPEAVRWALDLYAERMVGDVPGRGDDPPVVVALSRFGPRDLARLVRTAGLLKLAFAESGPRPSPRAEGRVRFTAADRVRFGFFRRLVGEADPRLVPAAVADLDAIEGDRKRALGRLGLVTLGRLLALSEPHRARWAIQHLPYGVARLARVKRASPLPRGPRGTWEAWIFGAAWARLLAEQRLAGRPRGPL